MERSGAVACKVGDGMVMAVSGAKKMKQKKKEARGSHSIVAFCYKNDTTLFLI